MAAVYFAQNSLPVIGLLWNPRLLPFLYLVRYLMMMVGAVELLGLAWNLIRDRPARQLPNVWEGATFAGVAALVVLIVLGWMYQVLPGGRLEVQADNDKAVYTWGPFTATDTNTKARRQRVVALQLHGVRGPRLVLHRVLRRGPDDEADR